MYSTEDAVKGITELFQQELSIKVPSPDTDLIEEGMMDSLMLVIMGAISNARERVWIMTPYFLPERQMMGCLQAAAISGVDVLVLKPTILGGIGKTLTIIEQAENCALDTSVSSSFESSLGISILVDLASTSAHDIVAAGLDTLKWFNEDILMQPLKIERGGISPREKAICSKDINFKILQHFA